MSDPTLLATLLQETLIGNTQSIKNAQQKLTSLETDPNFINHLLLIPKEPSIPYNLQKAAILYTKVYAKHCFKNKHIANISELASSLMNFLGDNGISLKLRKFIAGTLDYILQCDRECTIKKYFFSNSLSLLQKAIESNFNNIDPVFIGFYVQIILSSSLNLSQQLIYFFRSGFIPFCMMNIQLLHQANKIIGQQNMQEIIQCLKLIKIYSYSFKLFGKKFPVMDPETTNILFDDKVTQLVNLSLQFEMKNNFLHTPLVFYQNNVNPQLCDNYHSIKADYVAGIKYIIRTLTTKVQQSQKLKNNQIIQRPMLIPLLISSVQQVLGVLPYHKIKSQSLVKLIEQIYDMLLVGVRSNVYYSVFTECRKELIQGCLFKTLLFNNEDYQNHFYSPTQFIDSLFQVIDKDATQFLEARKNQNAYEDQFEQIQNYDNLKTVAATLLEDICHRQDGLLSQVFNYIFSVLQGQVESQFPHTLLLVVLGILKNQISSRSDLQDQVMQFLLLLVNNCKIPKVDMDPNQLSQSQNEDNIKLSVLLITLIKYINNSNSLSSDLFKGVLNITNQILIGEQLIDTLRLIAFQLIQTICCFCEVGMPSKFLQILNSLLQTDLQDILLNKLLDTYFELFKLNDEEFTINGDLTIKTINNLSQFILRQIKKNDTNSSMAINKAWNVITGICENPVFIPKYIPAIEEAVIPLIPFADGKKYDFQENILMMLTSFINLSKQITNNQLIMFDIIPKLFYSTYHKNFGHSFETLQIFIYYGGEILKSNPAAVKAIIEMGITSMNTFQESGSRHSESDNCEGVLIIQSLILSCGKAFDSQMWIVITKSLHQRLENPVPATNLLKANLLATMSLVLMIGHQFFSTEDKKILIQKIFNSLPCFNVEYAPKVLIVTFSEMLTYLDQSYITQCLPFLMNSLIQLIRVGEEPFQTKSNDVQEKDYENVLTMMKNPVTQLNEVEHFKTKIKQLKQFQPQLFKKITMEISEENQENLKNIFLTNEVGNENRRIFKIKKEE